MQDEIVSKTKRKQEMHERQALGVALVALPESQIRLLGLPGGLELAVLEAKRITSHEARRRQMQYIGRLMRDTDPELLGLCFDTGQWRFGGGDPVQALAQFRERIWHALPGSLHC